MTSTLRARLERLGAPLRCAPANERPTSDEAYDPDASFQWWYFDARLDDGHRLLTFYTLNAPGIETFGVNVVLRAPDGATIKDPIYPARADFRPHAGRFGGRFGEGVEARFEPGGDAGHGVYHLTTRGPRITYALEVHPTVAPFSPLGPRGEAPRAMIAAGKALAGRSDLLAPDRFRYACFVPRGTLRGTVIVDGVPRAVHGLAYHEHGMYTFPMGELSPAWFWLHAADSRTSLVLGTLVAPFLAYTSRRRKTTHGGYAYLHHDGERLLSTLDPTGLVVDVASVRARDLGARGAASMAWDLDATLRRPGLHAELSVRSHDVLEYFAVDPTPTEEPYWGQTVARAELVITRGGPFSRVRTRRTLDAVLETMRNGRP